jgi:hypothetical protein
MGMKKGGTKKGDRGNNPDVYILNPMASTGQSPAAVDCL